MDARDVADPRFFLDAELAAGATIDLPGSVAHHAARVLRLRDADRVVLFNGRGGEYHGRLAAGGSRAELTAHLAVERESALAVTLLQAWIATDKMEMVIEKAVELGVTSIVLVPARRSVVRLEGARLARRMDRLRDIVVAACCQCGRNRVPEVEAVGDLRDGLHRAAARAAGIILHCRRPGGRVRNQRTRARLGSRLSPRATRAPGAPHGNRGARGAGYTTRRRRRLSLTSPEHRQDERKRMGLLDSILGGALGGGAGGQADQGTAALMQLALQLLAGSAGQGGQGGGGLMDLLQQFQQAGLGAQADSWVSTGQNMPISPEQLMQVFGRGRVEQMAASTGMGVDQVSSGLSDLLPQLIDRVTPQGQVEEAGLQGALADLSRMLPR
jgi:RsmE family RNA methyltransferase